jgi:hypothetical protein
MILKDGGNQFSGSAFMGGTKGTWVANNIDDRLTERGLCGFGVTGGARKLLLMASITSKHLPDRSAGPL